MTSAISLPPVSAIDGVSVRPLRPLADERGDLVEVFRESWAGAAPPVQWNIERSRPRVLRGPRVHLTNKDRLVVLSGRMLVVLVDLRKGAADGALVFESTGEAPELITIPPGVAHGLYYPEATIHLAGVSEYWKAGERLGCRWDDPAIAAFWPDRDPIMDDRDRSFPSLAGLREIVRAAGL